MHDVLYKGLAREMNDNTSVDPGEHDALGAGPDRDRAINRPVAHRPHAAVEPATYTGVFDHIRELFAETSLSKQRATPRAVSPSTSRAADVKPAAGRARSPSR